MTIDKLNSKRYDYALDGLRGFAALSVAYAHVFGFRNLLDRSWHPNEYFAYLQPAHASVLIFFIISGYVIGLTTFDKSFSLNNTKQYLIRRFIRLVPIYWIAIVISFLALPVDNFSNILGNSLFLQILIFPTLQSNPILWTLNYEVIYYLLFLLIWWLKPSIKLIIGFCISISFLGWVLPNAPQLLSSYASGWIFWIFGLWLSQKKTWEYEIKRKIPVISYLCLLIASNHFETGKVILYGLGFRNITAGAVNFSDIALLPICLLIVGEVTNQKFRFYKLFQFLSFIIPLSNIVLFLIIGRIFENGSWTTATLLTLCSMIFWQVRNSTNLIAKLSLVGSISYAFYVLHMPIAYLVNRYTSYQGTFTTFLTRLILWFLITVMAAALLELVIQPYIKSRLNHLFVNVKN